MRLRILVLLLLSGATMQSASRFITQQLDSKFLPAPRTVRICLPLTYSQSPARRYPTLYLHDGQNVYTTAGTNIAFGWGNWAVDKTADELAAGGKIQELILVAIDNSPARINEYSGSHHPSTADTNTAYENYSAFLSQELKPFIDKTYRTKPEPDHTGVMGSSMGGICSLALAWDHPEVFGLAASLSGAFQIPHTNFLNHVLREYTGKPKPFKIYLDSGVTDFMGGDDGKSLTAAVASELRRIGWDKNLSWYVDEKPLSVAELEQSGLPKD